MSHNLIMKNLFLISGLNLSSLSLKPLPLVVSLQALGGVPIGQINVCDFDKQGGNSRKFESAGTWQSMKKLSKMWNTFSAFTILFPLNPPTTSLRCGHGKAPEHRKKQWGTKKKDNSHQKIHEHSQQLCRLPSFPFIPWAVLFICSSTVT